jgi:hypothetical protein
MSRIMHFHLWPLRNGLVRVLLDECVDWRLGREPTEIADWHLVLLNNCGHWPPDAASFYEDRFADTTRIGRTFSKSINNAKYKYL